MFMQRINPNISHHIVALCPSCHHNAGFVYAGEQRWPRKIAEAAGLPPVVQLWNCEHCHTTVSDTELNA